MDEPVPGPGSQTRSALWPQLVALHERSWGWALHCCGRHQQEAHDVLQEAYCRAVHRADTFAATAALQTWFFGIIRNVAREQARRRLRQPPDRQPTSLAGDPPPDQALIRCDENARLQACLDQLSERQREVLHLVFYQDLTVEAAAGIMAVSVGTARQHYHRGKQALRRLLEEEQP